MLLSTPLHLLSLYSHTSLSLPFPFTTPTEDHLDICASEGVIDAIIPLLMKLNGGEAEAQKMPKPIVEELERDICFILGLMAIKTEHQQAICAAGALPTLVSMVKRYASLGDVNLGGISAQTCRRTADAITNLAHENSAIKSKVRQEGGIPPLVSLLNTIDAKVQRAIAGSLRTLAFKNEENKTIIVDLGALPLLIHMLHSIDTTIHYEAVGVIGNLVHSSANIKTRVLNEGALQPVINLLSSECHDSQREAALLLGQFATATEHDYKCKIVQRGAVPPLIKMLEHDDPQLQEMAAFALGRLAQSSDNQAGICAAGGLLPLLDLLESESSNLQHNAAFALYGLSDNADNLLHFVHQGAIQRILDCELVVQASKDCVEKTKKRLTDKLHSRVLGQILYTFQGSRESIREKMAISLALLHYKDANYPLPNDRKDIFIEKKALNVLSHCVTDPTIDHETQRQGAQALAALAEACGAKADLALDPPAPPEPKVYLGEQYVNNSTLSDVTFVVEGRKFHAHRIALLASSDIFKSMFDGEYKESSAAEIPIPNIRWEVFEAMMRCIYTGSVKVPPELAQELLEAADQYMLDTLKKLCEKVISDELTPENVGAAFDLAEAYNATELSKRCALYMLDEYMDIYEYFSDQKQPSVHYAVLMKKMAPRLKKAVVEEINKAADAVSG